MAIEIIPINGKNSNVDYERLEKTFKTTLGKSVSAAKVFIISNLPMPISTEANVDLFLIIAIEDKKGNYYIAKSNENGRAIYFHNQIIPIKFVTQFKDDRISIDSKNQLYTENAFIDYETELTSFKFGFRDYLVNKCGFENERTFINPLIFILNKEEEIFTNGYIVSNFFDFISLTKYFRESDTNIFISYSNWKTEFGFNNINDDIERIVNQASKDSEIGFLTKKKIERFTRQLSSSKKIFEELNKNLIIIEGKAGTGKSSELLLLTLKCIKEGQNTLFLTYNNLLIYEIAKTVKSYVNSRLDVEDDKRGEGEVLTLHSFFYRLSKSLGVLHILSEERIKKLLEILRKRMRSIYDVISKHYNEQNFNSAILKTLIQNNSDLDIGEKEIGIDFINFISKERINRTNSLNKLSALFFNHKRKLLENIAAKEVFLADYYGVLKNTLLQIENPIEFYKKYDVENKHELLDVAIGLSNENIGEKDGNTIITEKGFIKFKNRRIGARKRKRIVFIDEAQDCHRLEKDILLSIYGAQKIVVASGGKEQLIRHIELCNWEASKGKRLSVLKHETLNKSYRIKKTAVEFCNYIANKFEIDLNLEPIESEDVGEIIFDFRKEHSENEMVDLLKYLNTKGEVNGCTPYESLITLLDSQKMEINSSSSSIESGIINEYENIESNLSIQRNEWAFKEKASHNDILFWDGTSKEKSKLNIPSSLESRLIYYESCRGLEAWSVMCLNLDSFFSRKRNDPEAEKYLIGDLFLSMDNERRKSMYSATWTLMALTRVIDTLYIQIDDSGSEFGKLTEDYLKMNKNNKNIKIYR